MSSVIFNSINSFINQELSGDSLSLAIGKLAGTLIAHKLKAGLGSNYYAEYEGKKLEEINVQTVTYGKEILIVYGNVKLSGNIIWNSGLKELKNIITKQYTKTKNSYAEYEYKVSLAIAICEGEIDEISRIWINNSLIDLSEYNIRVHKGGEEQLPDSLIEKIEGKGKVSAYRGLAYVVIEDFPIGRFHNKIPKFSFEVKRNHVFRDENKLENLINAIVMIPGSGEFVYDTQIQKKRYVKNQLTETVEEIINSHTEMDESNAVVSLNQWRETLPSVQWVSPVVNWFATSLDSGKCQILPGVEFKDENTITFPDTWKVAGYERQNAHLITQKNKSPIYGGTTNDESILRYLMALKARGYQVMFYPMILVDNIEKPWRGRIYANNSEDVKEFFDGMRGYKNFILHYAKLVKGHVDAFIIGSELVGLTKFRDKENNFSTVDKLLELADEVKRILGKKVKVSYGADWSEYHHTDEGWYHLDKLWASSSIDFIGIDAYFSLTDRDKTVTDYKEVMRGWDSGEGFDYYLDYEGKGQSLSKEYAWKNIKWWWENVHYNPNGKQTAFVPKSKKIWFTEVGFPSIDCATNQPNVFFDPYSSESAVPKYSKGKVDFYAQRVGLFGTEMRWKDSEMIENKFIWAWDARPHPYWTDRKDVWADAMCWYRGHWIQGKLGQSSLREILTDVCLKPEMQPHQFDVSRINQHVTGFYIFHNTIASDIIEDLRKLYFFDVVESDGVVCFVPRENKEVYRVNCDDLLLRKDGRSSLVIENINNDRIISKICLSYVKQEHAFVVTNVYTQNNTINIKNHKNLNIPVVLQEEEAREIVNKMMQNITSEKIVYTFSLPLKYVFLKSSDLIEIEYRGQKHLMRVINVAITWHVEILAITESE